MKVIATRKVNYNGIWYDAGDEFECNESDLIGLKSAGVEECKPLKPKASDRAIKKVKERDGSGD